MATKINMDMEKEEFKTLLDFVGEYDFWINTEFGDLYMFDDNSSLLIINNFIVLSFENNTQLNDYIKLKRSHALRSNKGEK